MQIIANIDGPIEVIEDQGPRPDPSYLDQFTTAQLLAEVRRRRPMEQIGHVCVVAGNPSQCHAIYGPVICEALDVSRHQGRYVRDRRDLVGLEAPVVVLVGTYRDRADWSDLVGEFGGRRARILCLPEVWNHEAAVASLRAQARVLGLPVPEGR